MKVWKFCVWLMMYLYILELKNVEAENFACIAELVVNSTVEINASIATKGERMNSTQNVTSTEDESPEEKWARCFPSRFGRAIDRSNASITESVPVVTSMSTPPTVEVTEARLSPFVYYGCGSLTDKEQTEFKCILLAIKDSQARTGNCTNPEIFLSSDVILSYNCTNVTELLDILDLLLIVQQVLRQTKAPSTQRTPTIENIYEKLNQSDVELDLHSVNNISSTLEQTLEDGNSTGSKGLQMLTKVLSHLSEVEITSSQTVQTFSRVSTTVIQLYNDTDSLTEEVMPDLLYSMENVLAATSMNENINIHTPEIDLFVERVERNLSNGDKFTLSSYVGTIALPVTVFDGKTSRVSVIVYKTVNQRWSVKKGYQNAQIGSNIMSVSLQQPENNTVHKLDVNVTGAVVVVLPTNVTKREKSRLCTYWSFEKSYWDTEGGTVLQKNDTHTKCRYDHMTNFAVLVLYYNDYDPVTEEESRTLYILTALGCSVSIACLLVCLIIYVYLQVLSNDTVMIHANLSLSLMLAQLVLVTSDGASKYPHACKIVTVLLHFLFLSAFTWMLVEGVALYFSCSRAITNWGNTRIKYMVMGWGIPSVIVLVSLGATFPNYGDGLGDNCWLSIKNGLIWSFMGPLIIIVLVNLVILGLVMRAFLSLRSNSRKSEAARIRASLRAIVTLLPILGITWLFGLLVPLSDVFHYLFVIGNSTQGMMIFFLHCVCNSVVRKKFIEKRKRQSSSAWSGDLSDLSDLRGHSVVVSRQRKSKQRFGRFKREYSINPREDPYCWM